MLSLLEIFERAQERMKTLTYESYEQFAAKKLQEDKTLVYNDEEMEEIVYEQSI